MSKKEDKKTKEAQPQTPQEPQSNEAESQLSHVHHSAADEVDSILHIPQIHELSKAHVCGGLTFILFGIIAILVAIAEVIVSALGAATVHYYDSQQSGRMVAMVLLVVIATVSTGMVIYAIDGVRRKHSKPLHATAVVLGILILIQVLTTGVSVNVTQKDELAISQSLSDSFTRAKEGDLKQAELWDATQAELKCCGLYGADDYKNQYAAAFFAPDIPASCCPSYTQGNTTLDKTRDAMCKANRSYWKEGCRLPVLEVVADTSLVVIVVTVVLIVTEIIVAILAAVLSKQRKNEKRERIEITLSSLKTEDQPQLSIVTK